MCGARGSQFGITPTVTYPFSGRRYGGLRVRVLAANKPSRRRPLNTVSFHQSAVRAEVDIDHQRFLVQAGKRGQQVATLGVEHPGVAAVGKDNFPAGTQPAQPGARFEVNFQFARFSPTTNKRLSRIPMPLIAAQPGFRSKTWMLGRESGAVKGVYEWDTIEAAEDYWTSFPMRLMKRRAVPETLTREIHAAG